MDSAMICKNALHKMLKPTRCILMNVTVIEYTWLFIGVLLSRNIVIRFSEERFEETKAPVLCVKYNLLISSVFLDISYISLKLTFSCFAKTFSSHNISLIRSVIFWRSNLVSKLMSHSTIHRNLYYLAGDLKTLDSALFS